MKISIAEVKRRLDECVKYTGEFIGTNAKRCPPDMQVTNRIVLKNKSQLVSMFLDGPKQGEVIYLNWKYVRAEERNGSIFLSMTETEPEEEFLKITIHSPSN